MKSRWGVAAHNIGLGCALLSLLASTPAHGQDEESEESDVSLEAASEAETDAPADGAETEAPIEPGARPAPDPLIGGRTTIGLERLPGDGYPAPRVRGILGGSLWLNMHGLQWPYMPPRDGEAGTRIAFSGNGWVDTSYQSVESGLPQTDPSIREWRQQSRFVLRTTPTFNAEDGWFVQGQGEIVLNGAAPARTEDFLVADDLYVRVGRWNQFDITAGRFQGWEIFHLGMGLDLNTVERLGALTAAGARPVDLYGLTYFWDRPNGPGRIAAHYYPSDTLRFELLGQVGSSGLNSLGVRPVGILDLGVLKVKLGAEYGKETPRQDSADRKDSVVSRGVAGAVQVVLDPRVEAGLTFAHALVDAYNVQGVLDAARSNTTTSFGGFANARVAGPLIVGAGAFYTDQHNLKLDPTGTLNDVLTHLQVFGAVQYGFWDQLYVKLVVAHANAHFNPLSNPPPVAEYRNEALSARLRMFFLF